ncbi:hypothetical protein BC835DRAFT_1306041 [Cytidiella melzeri]|nr:hypothetical protein BC835DRAFT_1306041 [Cytidiella melzeri]
MSSPTPSTPGTWNKTPPPSTNVLNDTSFPTPETAARMAAEERQARMTAHRLRKEKENADKLGKSDAGAPLPTPLSANTSVNPALEPETTPSTENQDATESLTTTLSNDNDNPFAIVPSKNKQGRRARNGRTGKAQEKNSEERTSTEKGVKDGGSREEDSPPISSVNRFEILGLNALGLDAGGGVENEEADVAEILSPTPNGSRKKRKSKAIAPKEKPRGTRNKLTPSTPLISSKKAIAPYDVADSPHEETRTRMREERRASQQGVLNREGSEEEELWRAAGGLDVDQEMEDGTLMLSNEDTQGRPEKSKEVPPRAQSPMSNEMNSTAHHGASRTMTNERSQDWTPRTADISRTPLAALQPPTVKDNHRNHSLPPPNHCPHVPKTQKTHELEFSTPTANFEAVRGNDPYFAFNNLSNKQAEAWPKIAGFSLLVRQAGKGRPMGATEQARKEEILSLLRRTIGTPPGIRLTAPSPAQDRPGNRIPPYNFLLYNIDEQYYELLTSCGGCISTTEGTLFFSTNGPTFDSYIGSISGFGDEEEHNLRGLVNSAFDECGLDDLLSDIVKSQAHLCNLQPDLAVKMVRNSLEIKMVEAKKEDGPVQRVAHLFLATPTYDILQWRAFRDKAMKANFADPFIGMNTAPFTGWQCGICTSALHPTFLCPILTEQGWLYNQAVSDLNSDVITVTPKGSLTEMLLSQSYRIIYAVPSTVLTRARVTQALRPLPNPKPTRTLIEAAPPTAFTTMVTENGGRSSRGGRSERGRGNRGRGGRGTGGRGRGA